jgi:hypothetical protein
LGRDGCTQRGLRGYRRLIVSENGGFAAVRFVL